MAVKLRSVACAHGDAFEFLEFAEEVFDEVRHLYISASSGMGMTRRGCWETTIFAPRSCPLLLFDYVQGAVYGFEIDLDDLHSADVILATFLRPGRQLD